MPNTKFNMLNIILILTGVALTSSAWAEDKFSSSVKIALDNWTVTLNPSDLQDFSAAWNEAATQALDMDQYYDQSQLPTRSSFKLFPDPLAPEKIRSLSKNENFMEIIDRLAKDDHFVSNFHAVSMSLVKNNPTYKTFSLDKVTQYWLGVVIIAKHARESVSGPLPCHYPFCSKRWLGKSEQGG